MRARFLMLAALLLPGTLSAQTIRGVVFEYGTSNRIAGATIEVVSKKGVVTATTSDSAGYFVIFPSTTGRMTVRATHPSYVAERTDTVTSIAKETVTMIVRMTRQAIPIAPIVVTARSTSVYGGFYERQRRAAMGKFIGPREIERQNPFSVEQLLRTVPGVQIEKAITGNIATVRSFGGECMASIFVDGVPMRQGDGFDIDDLVPMGQLAAVEVYPDVAWAPFEFGGGFGGCGTILFWTNPIRNPRPITVKRIGIAALLVAAVVLVETVFMHSKKADISDKPLRDFTLAPSAPAPGHHRGESQPPLRARWRYLRPA